MNTKSKKALLDSSPSKSPLIYKVRTNKTTLLKGSIIQVTEVKGTKAMCLNFVGTNPTPINVHLSTLELSLITK